MHVAAAPEWEIVRPSAVLDGKFARHCGRSASHSTPLEADIPEQIGSGEDAPLVAGPVLSIRGRFLLPLRTLGG